MGKNQFGIGENVWTREATLILRVTVEKLQIRRNGDTFIAFINREKPFGISRKIGITCNDRKTI